MEQKKVKLAFSVTPFSGYQFRLERTRENSYIIRPRSGEQRAFTQLHSYYKLPSLSKKTLKHFFHEIPYEFYVKFEPLTT
jgi:hypothetical protein